MDSGIYYVIFKAQTGRFADGLAVVDNGKVHGGDQSYLYRGFYKTEGQAIEAEIQVSYYRGEAKSVLGHLAKFTLNLSGKSTQDSFIVNGHVFGQSQLAITIEGQKQADLVVATRRSAGSELVGLIPLAALREAGRYFLDAQQQVCTGVSEAELIRVAVKSMGLDELGPFDAKKRVIEYATQEQPRRLVSMPLTAFADELASISPAPGGGSVAALAGAMAAGLAAMVPNLTVGKKGYKKVRAEMNAAAEEAQLLKDEFLRAIDDDTAAFNALMDCFALPKTTPEELAARQAAITAATKGATEVPLATLKRTVRTLELVKIAAEKGNQNSLSDAGVGGAMALACATGAYYNVLINLKGMDLSDPALAEYAAAVRAQADTAIAAAREGAAAVQAVLMAGLDAT